MAILLGLALVQVKDQAHITASSLFSAVYEMFISILDWILYLLPLGLFCLLADQASEVGVDALRAMLSIVAVYLVCFGIMAALYLAQIRRATGKSVPEIWRIFKEPFTLAFVASSDSALPSILRRMGELHYPSELVSSVVPLSAVLNRHGTAIVFAITTV
ncbi:MAG: cation:dicarboxylate symporter family transporter, partial [Terrimicrobiaceae bacterium]